MSYYFFNASMASTISQKKKEPPKRKITDKEGCSMKVASYFFVEADICFSFVF